MVKQAAAEPLGGRSLSASNSSAAVPETALPRPRPEPGAGPGARHCHQAPCMLQLGGGSGRVRPSDSWDNHLVAAGRSVTASQPSAASTKVLTHLQPAKLRASTGEGRTGQEGSRESRRFLMVNETKHLSGTQLKARPWQLQTNKTTNTPTLRDPVI